MSEPPGRVGSARPPESLRGDAPAPQPGAAPLGRDAEAVIGSLSRLARELRGRGVPAGVGPLLGAHRALAAVDASMPRSAYLALRAALCASRHELLAFDEAYAACFSSPGTPAPGRPPGMDSAMSAGLPRFGVPGSSPEAIGEQPAVRPAAWSELELLRHRDFALFDERERQRARLVLERLARRGPTAIGRRTRPSRRRGHRQDLRATVRASLRHQGEPLERRYRERRLRGRPLVLVCDVSGSMAPYARMLLAYLHACVAARRRVEAFVFGTRLTRVTRELSARDPDRALARASAAVSDIAAGTRIGDALATLNREHGRRVGRGAVVVVLSDGWDRGDPLRLTAEMARLRRCAHATIWLNPLKAHPSYEPLTRGMQAALPHVDHFLAGNSLASLEELADILERRSRRHELPSRRHATQPG